MSIAFAMEWFYLGVFALRMGATPAHIGVLTAGRALLMTVGSSLSYRWSCRFNHLPNAPIRALSTPVLLARTLLYLIPALVPFMPGSHPDLLVLFVVLSALPHGVSQGVFLGMLPDAIGKEHVAQVVSRRSVLMNTCILVTMPIVGQLMEWLPKPTNYQIGFGIAFAAAFVSWLHIKAIRIPVQTSTNQSPERQVRRVNVWANRDFRRFAFMVGVLNVSVFMGGAVIPLQLVRGLNASDAWISVFGIFEMAAGALFTAFLGKMLAKLGSRTMIVFSAAMTIPIMVILAITPILPPYIIGVMLFGAGWFTVNVLLYNKMVQIVPSSDATQYAAAYQLVINAALFLGPLISTAMVEIGIALPTVILFVAAMRTFATILTITTNITPSTVTSTSESVQPAAGEQALDAAVS
jgi:hypothetical protein